MNTEFATEDSDERCKEHSDGKVEASNKCIVPGRCFRENIVH